MFVSFIYCIALKEALVMFQNMTNENDYTLSSI